MYSPRPNRTNHQLKRDQHEYTNSPVSLILSSLIFANIPLHNPNPKHPLQMNTLLPPSLSPPLYNPPGEELPVSSACHLHPYRSATPCDITTLVTLPHIHTRSIPAIQSASRERKEHDKLDAGSVRERHGEEVDKHCEGDKGKDRLEEANDEGGEFPGCAGRHDGRALHSEVVVVVVVMRLRGLGPISLLAGRMSAPGAWEFI
ncbi:hypothetical protein BDD12DRAFT_803779 [Trichophaea hybrida]|nr:hypothetical protein BDD12DRAFT_803779 [Trichophaea hybrida]